MRRADASDCRSVACDFQDVLLQPPARAKRGFATERCPARRPGAAAERRAVGIPADDLDAAWLDAYFLRDNLNQRGPRSLTLIGDARRAPDAAVRAERDPARLVRGHTHLLWSVESWADGGLLDECGQSDAAINLAASKFGLLLAQAIIVHQLEQARRDSDLETVD